jgi:hypothetical protein
MIAALLLALAQQAPAPGCGPAELERTLRHRLAALAAQSRAVVPQDIELSLEFQDGAWRLSVARPGRAPVLRRLALPGDECTLAAETAALVAERWLVAVRPAPPEPGSRRPETAAAEAPPDPGIDPIPPLMPGPEAPPPEAQEAEAADPEPPGVRPPKVLELPAQASGPDAAPEAGADLGIGFSAGGAALLDRGGDWQRGFQVQLFRRTQDWTFALSFAAASGVDAWSRRRMRGSLDDGTSLLAFSATRCGGRALRLCAGPYLAVRSQEQGEGRSWELEPEGGGAIGIDLGLGPRARLGVTLLAGVPLGTGSRALQVTAAASFGLLVF